LKEKVEELSVIVVSVLVEVEVEREDEQTKQNLESSLEKGQPSASLSLGSLSPPRLKKGKEAPALVPFSPSPLFVSF
jgi:hypothetical protein